MLAKANEADAKANEADEATDATGAGEADVIDKPGKADEAKAKEAAEANDVNEVAEADKANVIVEIVLVDECGQNRTEQLRKLGKLLSYYLDKSNHKGVFICHKQRMQSSVAVGTSERGCAPSRSALFPGN